jgi:HSP20 family protein
MALVRYQPVNLFEQFNNEINRYLVDAHDAAANQEHDWSPAVDIREDENSYVLTADIPGVKRDDIEVTQEDGVLTLKGERKQETEVSTEDYRRRERVYGNFRRQFSLPDTVDADNINASAHDGVLEISIPKQAKAEPRRITVK